MYTWAYIRNTYKNNCTCTLCNMILYMYYNVYYRNRQVLFLSRRHFPHIPLPLPSLLPLFLLYRYKTYPPLVPHITPYRVPNQQNQQLPLLLLVYTLRLIPMNRNPLVRYQSNRPVVAHGLILVLVPSLNLSLGRVPISVRVLPTRDSLATRNLLATLCMLRQTTIRRERKGRERRWKRNNKSLLHQLLLIQNPLTLGYNDDKVIVFCRPS